MGERSELARFLLPGLLIAEKSAHAVTTLLGSCVAVCLWDPQLGLGGINHYLLPFWNGDGLKTPRFGNIAIPKLIERMEAMGSERSRLAAKVFGGASLFSNPSGLLGVGDRNIQVAFHQLETAGIPVVSRHVGGKQGRKIIFNTQNGQVWMKFLSGQEAQRVKESDPRFTVRIQAGG